jgi:hypothetical protein
MKITTEQIAAFGSASGLDFERRLLVAVCRRFPRAKVWYGEAPLAAMVSAGLARSRELGVETEESIVDYLSAVLLLGHGFEKDPQTRWAAEALVPSDETSPVGRMAELWVRVQAYRATVYGPKDALYRDAVAFLADKSVEELAKHASRSQRDLLVQFSAMFPTKFTALGQEPCYELTRLAVEACRPFELLDRWAVVLVAEFMFLFGAGCMTDPLYAWAPRALQGVQGRAVDEKLELLLQAAQQATAPVLG